MLLTNHFTLVELTRSATARRLGIDNTPPQELMPRLILLAQLLEKIRASMAGAPVIVTSGYRCDKLNRAIGSRSSSDHVQGHAADFVAPAFGTPWRVATALARNADLLGIGQLILEGVGGKQWVHVSTHRPEREVNRILTITDAGTFTGIRELPP
jgi:zinc D-Ala-D-Ala carboxypeptidase